VVERSGAWLVAAARPPKWRNIASYRRSIIESRYATATFDYAPSVTPGLFYPERGPQMFYERVSFACGGDAILSWQMTYAPPIGSASIRSSRRFIASTVTMPIGERALGQADAR